MGSNVYDAVKDNGRDNVPDPGLPSERGRRGRPPILLNRTMINAIFYIAKTGLPWRDLPEKFGTRSSIHDRFCAWNRRGVLQRSRGGLTTKIHALVDRLGNPTHVHLTGENVHDVTQADMLIDKADADAFLADKAYDAGHVIEKIEAKAMGPVIPSRDNRKQKRPIDKHVYKAMHLVENFFCKILASLGSCFF